MLLVFILASLLVGFEIDRRKIDIERLLQEETVSAFFSHFRASSAAE